MRMSTLTGPEIVEANRRRYEALRAAGQDGAPEVLPPPAVLAGRPQSR